MLLGGKYTDPLIKRGPWFLQKKPENYVFKLEYLKEWPKRKYTWLKKMLEAIIEEKNSYFILYMPSLENNLPKTDLKNLTKFSKRPKKTCVEILFKPNKNFTNLHALGKICWTEMPNKWSMDLFRRTIAMSARKLIKLTPYETLKVIEICKKMVTTSS